MIVNETTAHNADGARKQAAQIRQIRQAQLANQMPDRLSSAGYLKNGKKPTCRAPIVSYSQSANNRNEQLVVASYSNNGLLANEISAKLVTGSIAKRWIDIAFSLIALMVLAPLFAFAGILIKFDSAGPALFKQRRIGRAGKEFTLYKFRSMHVGSDARVHKDYMTKLISGADEGCNLRGSNGCFKLEGDSRVTRVGKIIRKTSIDELPQIINVLKGEMSLVGPRPALSYEVEIYKPWHADRLLVRPGMTGLWQVGGRSEKNFDQMVELDIAYINKWSLYLDFKILLKTVFVVIRRQGAW